VSTKICVKQGVHQASRKNMAGNLTGTGSADSAVPEFRFSEKELRLRSRIFSLTADQQRKSRAARVSE
jgi:hypothetical protein